MHALSLTLWVWQNKVRCVRIDCISSQFAIDSGSPSSRVVEPFEYEDAATFGNDDAVAIDVEGARRLGGIFMVGQSSLALEAGENAERVHALRNSARKSQVAFVQPQHLSPLNQTRVARGTGGTDRVVWTGDSHVEGDFARRIVGHGARIVVMRPKGGVVVVALQLVDFIFGFDIAVLGDTKIDTNSRLFCVFPIVAGILDCFIGGIDADAAGPRATTDIFARLIFFCVEIALTSQRFAHVADFVGGNSAAAFEQRVAIIRKRVSIWCGQTNPGDHDPVVVGKFLSGGGSDHTGTFWAAKPHKTNDFGPYSQGTEVNGSVLVETSQVSENFGSLASNPLLGHVQVNRTQQNELTRIRDSAAISRRSSNLLPMPGPRIVRSRH